MTAGFLEGGFADPAPDAARAFRACLAAMARPGTIEQIHGARPPAGLSAAAGTLLLTLCDTETPVYLAGGLATADALHRWIAFHAGAPIVEDPADAAFALGSWEGLLPLGNYKAGRAEYPDRSATLIVETATLEQVGARLSGPGIRDSARLSLPEVDAFRQNRALFPRGLDFFFTSGDRLAALPRTTIVEAA